MLAHLYGSGFKHTFHHISIRPEHSSVMDTETVIEKLPHLPVAGFADVSTKQGPLRVIFTEEIGDISFGHRQITKRHGSFNCFLPRVHEDHDLMSLRN